MATLIFNVSPFNHLELEHLEHFPAWSSKPHEEESASEGPRVHLSSLLNNIAHDITIHGSFVHSVLSPIGIVGNLSGIDFSFNQTTPFASISGLNLDILKSLQSVILNPVDFITKTVMGGNDMITGSSGKDILAGFAGNDSIYGGDGNDAILGGAGNDLLAGGSGNDKISGAAGNDKLIGGTGVDFLTGGLGLDTFVFNKGDSVSGDVIVDFNAKQDHINIVGASFATISQTNTAAGLVITYDAHETIQLTGVHQALAAASFIF
jgi:Ca2+-binding RTX toxin-like protein